MKVISKLDGTPLEDGCIFRAPRAIHPAFKLPQSTYTEREDDGVMLRSRSWGWFLLPSVRRLELWIENQDKAWFCPHGLAIVWHRPEIYHYPDERNPTRIGVRIGYGFHVTTGQKDEDYTALFTAVHDHVMRAVDTPWLADKFDLGPVPHRPVAVDVRIEESLLVGSEPVEWVLWVSIYTDRKNRPMLIYTLQVQCPETRTEAA